MLTLLGYFTTLCISVNLIPQIWKIWRTKDVRSFSITASCIYVAGNLAGIIYGIGIGSGPVFWTSLITSITSIATLAAILAYRRHRAPLARTYLDAESIDIADAISALCPKSDTAFAVGAIIRNAAGDIVATGFSREWGGAWHAEEVALEKARRTGADLKNATIYSSLEPCSHRKSRPKSCSDLILEAGIRRVVYGHEEPSVFVVGKGDEVLRTAGVQVVRLLPSSSVFAEQNVHVLLNTGPDTKLTAI